MYKYKRNVSMGEYKYDYKQQNWSRVTGGHLKSSQPNRASPEGRDDNSLQGFCCRHGATKGIYSEIDVNFGVKVHQSSDRNGGFMEHYV